MNLLFLSRKICRCTKVGQIKRNKWKTNICKNSHESLRRQRHAIHTCIPYGRGLELVRRNGPVPEDPLWAITHLHRSPEWISQWLANSISHSVPEAPVFFAEHGNLVNKLITGVTTFFPKRALRNGILFIDQSLERKLVRLKHNFS